MLPLMNTAASAHKNYSQAQTCYKNKYVEEYHPGTRKNPGYVTSSEKIVERQCPRNLHFHGRKSHKHKNGQFTHEHHAHTNTSTGAQAVVVEPNEKDINSCIEGTVTGGVLGGALGGVLATKENWIWSIPAGAVGGALVGCQIDGGWSFVNRKQIQINRRRKDPQRFSNKTSIKDLSMIKRLAINKQR